VESNTKVGNTSIQWTDCTWNPIRGCSRVSPGCVNCYAERQAARFAREVTDPIGARIGERDGPFFGFVHKVNGHPAWTGKVELIESKLEEPLHWKKPCRVFVNSMSDLFHESLSDSAIDRVFAVMALCPHITFQVLTKRAKRMRHWAQGAEMSRNFISEWPLPNVWLGVSVENQQRADERIPLLLQTPAAVRFVSYEPALGPVDFDQIPITVVPGFFGSPLGWHHRGQCHKAENIPYPKLDWVIVGGESGPNARPFDIQWARQSIAQCKAAGVACFVKQLGSDPWESGDGDHQPNAGNRLFLKNSHGGDPSEWSEDLRVREFPRGTTVESTDVAQGRVAKP
jgi:protein gp37